MSKPVSSNSKYHQSNQNQVPAPNNTNPNQASTYNTSQDFGGPASQTKRATQAATTSLKSSPNYNGSNSNDQYNWIQNPQTESKSQRIQIPNPSSLSTLSSKEKLDRMYKKLNSLKENINQQLAQMKLPNCIATPNVDVLESQPSLVTVTHKNDHHFAILDENRDGTFDVIKATRTDADLESLQIPKSRMPNGKKIAWLARNIVLSNSDKDILKSNKAIPISVCLISVGKNQEVLQDNVPFVYFREEGVICKVNITVEESENGPVRSLNKDTSGKIIPLKIAILDKKNADPYEALMNAFYPPN